MKASPELREKMWELCYDLLPEGERSALIARIKSDPHAARLYAEVRLQADLVGYASTVDDPSLILTTDAEKLKSMELAPAGGRRKEATQPAAASSNKPSQKSLWAANAAAIAAGLALVLLMGMGFFRPQGMDDQLAKLVVTTIEIPGKLTSGLSTSQIAVRTASPAHKPIAVPLEVKVVSEFGDVLYREVGETSADGLYRVDLSGDAIRAGARIQVEARGESFPEQQVAQQAEHAQPISANFVEAELPVARQEPFTYYVLEKPTAAAGEPVDLAAVAIDPFVFDRQPPPTGEVVIKHDETTQRIQPNWSISDNVAKTTIQVPAEGVERAPQPTEASKLEKKPALLEIEQPKDVALYHKQHLESKGLAGGENASRAISDIRLRAGAVEGTAGLPARPIAPGPSASGDERKKELDKGKESLSEKSAAKKDAADDSEVLAKAERQVLDDGRPVEIVLPADQAGKELQVTVIARGVEVDWQKVKPKRQRYVKDGREQREEVKMTLQIPPEVDGNVDVKVIDPANPTKVVLEQQLYRPPARELKIEPLNRKDRYDPGELVQLQFKIVNERGERAAGGVVARVVKSDLVPDERRKLNMLADVVRELTPPEAAAELGEELAQSGRPESGAEGALAEFGALRGNLQGAPAVLAPGPSKPANNKPNDQSNDADKLGVNEPRSPNRAVVSDLKQEEQPAAGATPAAAPEPAGPAAGQRFARSDSEVRDALQPSDAAMLGGFAEGYARRSQSAVPAATYFDFSQPVTTVSNELAIDRQIQSLKNENERIAAAWQATIGRVLVGGGLVALAILGLLFVMQQEVRWSSGTLALVASAASLIVGAAWIAGNRQEMTVAMAPSRDDSVVNSPAESAAKTAPLPRSAAPKALEDRTAGMPAGAPAADTYGAQTAQPPSAPAIAATPVPPLKEAVTRLESAAAPAAALPADKLPADKLPADKLTEGGRDHTAGANKPQPAQQAASVAPEGKAAEKSGEEKQLNSRRAAMAGADTGGGAGGFGGGSARGGLGGKPPAAPDARRDSGATGPAAPTATANAFPPMPATLKGADDATRDFARITDGEKRLFSVQGGAPPSIYFNPQLTTDANGIVTLEFQLPAVASEYRVLLDAYGNGRVGSSADVRIVCKPAE